MDMAQEWNDVFGSSSSSEDEEDILNYMHHIRPQQRRQREPQNYMLLYNAREFHKRYRLTKQTVHKLMDKIGHNLEYNSDKNNPLTPMEQIVCTLRYYATGSFQSVVADLSGAIHQTTAGRIIHRVSHQIALLRDEYIRFPATQMEIDSMCAEFYQICGMPYTIGTIDCSHIPILAVGGEYGELYRNRNKYHSLNVQTISDPKLKIRDIVCRWYGSAHDSTIFNACEKCARFENGEYPGKILLGDNGYACKSYLLTPLASPSTPAERAYNRAHITTRSTVERQYGLWKRRFPCLEMGLRCRIEKAQAIIVATSVLHNMCIDERDEAPLIDPDVGVQLARARRRYRPVPVQLHRREGNVAMRNAVIRTHF